MKLAVRANKKEVVKLQLMSLLGIGSEDIVVFSTSHTGIMLLSVNLSEQFDLKSLRNIDMIFLDDSTFANLQDVHVSLLPKTTPHGKLKKDKTINLPQPLRAGSV